jgi:uncharacterized protein DUF3131
VLAVRSRSPKQSAMRRLIVIIAAVLMLSPVAAGASPPPSVGEYHGLSAAQRSVLRDIARDTWRFYSLDVDPATHLPMDNLTFSGGTPTAYGRYTSASNVGVYLWAVVAAYDMGLVPRPEAAARVRATLGEVATLRRDHGFLFQWYNTTNGHVIRNPGDIDCAAEPTPTFDNCYFVSNVDNGWYASGLIVARQALPELRQLIGGLIAPMDFGQFYDGRAETHCNVNPAIPGNQPTGQMFGGYYAGLPPDQGENWTHYYHNGAFYSDPRISAYLGMGHDRPGFLLAGPMADGRLLADLHRSAVGPGIPGLGGPLRIPRLGPDVHSDIRRRHVRGADGQRGGAGDVVGSAQLRAC